MLQSLNPLVATELTHVSSVSHQAKYQSLMKRSETCVLWTNRDNLLKKQIQHLVPNFLGRDLSYAYMILGTYQAIATTQEVLDFHFAR